MARTDTKYRYSGSLTGVTLADGREVMLHTGADISLPADNEYVKTLVAQKLLTETPAEEVSVQDVPKQPAKKEASSVS